jgi:hypothetical protein
MYHLLLLDHLRVLGWNSLIGALVVNVDVCIVIIYHHDLSTTAKIGLILNLLLLVNVLIDIALALLLVRILLGHYPPVQVVRDLSTHRIVLVLWLVPSLQVKLLVSLNDLLFLGHVAYSV